jgi:hypothetical protein
MNHNKPAACCWPDANCSAAGLSWPGATEDGSCEASGLAGA